MISSVSTAVATPKPPVAPDPQQIADQRRAQDRAQDRAQERSQEKATTPEPKPVEAPRPTERPERARQSDAPRPSETDRAPRDTADSPRAETERTRIAEIAFEALTPSQAPREATAPETRPVDPNTPTPQEAARAALANDTYAKARDIFAQALPGRIQQTV